MLWSVKTQYLLISNFVWICNGSNKNDFINKIIFQKIMKHVHLFFFKYLYKMFSVLFQWSKGYHTEDCVILNTFYTTSNSWYFSLKLYLCTQRQLNVTIHIQYHITSPSKHLHLSKEGLSHEERAFIFFIFFLGGGVTAPVKCPLPGCIHLVSTPWLRG